MKCKTCHQETDFILRRRCWCCSVLYAASQRLCGCEHLWEAWRTRGHVENIHGKTLTLYWSRTCTLCGELQSLALEPEHVPPFITISGIDLASAQ